jgi:hypothetical protein
MVKVVPRLTDELQSLGVRELGPVLNRKELDTLLRMPEMSDHHQDDGHHIGREKPTHLPFIAKLLMSAIYQTWPSSPRPILVDDMMKLYRLEAGKGVVAPHKDLDYDNEHGMRALWSILVYLNDDYKGGRTVFDGKVIAPHARTGHAMLFPHNLTHEGRVVTYGTKFVLKTDLFVPV